MNRKTVLKDNKIAICYNHVAKYWTEEYYKGCLRDWRDLQKFILPRDTKNGFECSCGVVWSDKAFINHMICPLCDKSYQLCLTDWLDLQKYIVPEDTKNGFKCSCGVVWSDKRFINNIDMICQSCDQSCQPCLSNPINKEHVLLYIHPKYYKYIFEDGYTSVLPYLKENWDKDKYEDLIRDIDFAEDYLLIKELSPYGTVINVYNKFIHYYLLVSENKKTVSSFCKSMSDKTYLKNSQGLYEDIYSNRTEYHINGEYKGTGDEKIDQIIKRITTLVCEENVISSLCEFIKSEETLTLISKRDMDTGAEKILENIV